jgi:hypothetical protein
MPSVKARESVSGTRGGSTSISASVTTPDGSHMTTCRPASHTAAAQHAPRCSAAISDDSSRTHAPVADRNQTAPWCREPRHEMQQIARGGLRTVCITATAPTPASARRARTYSRGGAPAGALPSHGMRTTRGARAAAARDSSSDTSHACTIASSPPAKIACVGRLTCVTIETTSITYVRKVKPATS